MFLLEKILVDLLRWFVTFSLTTSLHVTKHFVTKARPLPIVKEALSGSVSRHKVATKGSWVPALPPAKLRTAISQPFVWIDPKPSPVSHRADLERRKIKLNQTFKIKMKLTINTNLTEVNKYWSQDTALTGESANVCKKFTRTPKYMMKIQTAFSYFPLSTFIYILTASRKIRIHLLNGKFNQSKHKWLMCNRKQKKIGNVQKKVCRILRPC